MPTNSNYPIVFQEPEWIKKLKSEYPTVNQNSTDWYNSNNNKNNGEEQCPEGEFFDPITRMCIKYTEYYSNILGGSQNPQGFYSTPEGQLMDKNDKQIGTYDDKNQLLDESGNVLGKFNKNGVLTPPTNWQDYNPYGDINLENSIYNFGKSLREGDALGTAGYGALSVLKLGRIGLSGYATENRNKYIEDYNRNKMMERDKGDFNYYLEDGGQVTKRMMPNEYLTNDNSANTNAELEKDEYVKNPDGSVQKVVGNSHEQGGVEVALENNTKIISDNLTIGNKYKEVNSKYGINVKANDTYATVIDKINKKSGLSYLLEEKEEIVKKLSKQQSNNPDRNSQSKNTNKVNIDFLTKKLNQIDKDKQTLEKQQSEAVDYVFRLQEESKPKSDTQVPLQENENEIDYNSIASKYGVDVETAKKIISQYNARNGGMYNIRKNRMYEDGGGIIVDNNNNMVKYSDEEKQMIKDYYIRTLTDETYKNLVKGLADNTVIVNLPFIKSHNMKDINVGRQGKGVKYHGDITDADVAGFTLHDWYKAKYGKDLNVLDNEELKKVQQEYQDAAKVLGIEYRKNSEKVVSEPDGIIGNVTSSYFRTKGTVKGKKSGTIDVDKVLATPDEQADLILKEYGLTKKQLLDEGKLSPTLKYIDIVPDIAADNNLSDEKTPPLDVEKEKENKDKPTLEADKYPTTSVNDEFNRYLMGLPDQSKLPPNGLEAPMLLTPRYGRIDPNLMSPERSLQAINDEVGFAMSQAEKYYDSQRNANISDLLSRGLDASNEAIYKIDQYNQEAKTKANEYNIAKSDQEEVDRIKALYDYENKVLQAKNVTDTDYRNYLDYNKAVQIQNYNSTKNINLMNQLYDNAQYDPNTGMIMVNGEWVAPTAEELFGLGLLNVQQQGNTKKEDKKENGGYFYDRNDNKLKLRKNKMK